MDKNINLIVNFNLLECKNIIDMFCLYYALKDKKITQ